MQRGREGGCCEEDDETAGGACAVWYRREKIDTGMPDTIGTLYGGKEGWILFLMYWKM